MNFLGNLIAKQKGVQKSNAAWWSAIMWIASGIYLFTTTPNASFFSFSALLFFIPELFVASLCFGILFYFAQRALAWGWIKLSRMLGPPMAFLVGLSGIALLIIQAWIVYLSARHMFFDLR
jgi:hypothetical protein